MRILEVPTGHIGIVNGEKGKLEFVSLQDYGKHKNIKADFLGYTDEINQVPHGKLLSLNEKWVITLSTQYGCSIGCKFCDVPKVGKGVNASINDLKIQLITALELHPEIQHTDRLNIHYARMGEPTFNFDVLDITFDLHDIISNYLTDTLIHPVISTMLPKNNKDLFFYLQTWSNIKNITFKGEAGLQFSINSTCDIQRDHMFNGNSLSLREIAYLADKLPMPVGRKYTLNFALADDYVVDANVLKVLFDTDKFMVKITPIHITTSCKDNNIKTNNGYFNYDPYRKFEKDLIEAGFDVLVFIPSIEEDSSRITCGNAILSDKGE